MTREPIDLTSWDYDADADDVVADELRRDARMRDAAARRGVCDVNDEAYAAYVSWDA